MAGCCSGGHVFFIPHRLMWQAMIHNQFEVPGRRQPGRNWPPSSSSIRANSPSRSALRGCGVRRDAVRVGRGRQRADSVIGGLAGGAGVSWLTALPGLTRCPKYSARCRCWKRRRAARFGIHFNWPFAMGDLAGKGLAPQVDLSAPIPGGPQRSLHGLGAAAIWRFPVPRPTRKGRVNSCAIC